MMEKYRLLMLLISMGLFLGSAVLFFVAKVVSNFSIRCVYYFVFLRLYIKGHTFEAAAYAWKKDFRIYECIHRNIGIGYKEILPLYIEYARYMYFKGELPELVKMMSKIREGYLEYYYEEVGGVLPGNISRAVFFRRFFQEYYDSSVFFQNQEDAGVLLKRLIDEYLEQYLKEEGTVLSETEKEILENLEEE